MNEDLMLSKSELAALDLLIDAMASEKAAAAMADPAAFIGAIVAGIVRVAKRVTPVAIRVTPQIAAAIGAQAAQDPKIQQLSKSLSEIPELTLEQLIVLRSIQPDR